MASVEDFVSTLETMLVNGDVILSDDPNYLFRCGIGSNLELVRCERCLWSGLRGDGYCTDAEIEVIQYCKEKNIKPHWFV
jgi:hypothetical protein